ncbi:adenylyltransferase/cytidyltransferase family protein [Halobacillus litoralis]|uniref:adenylyltransferase/cytidyltransferase family protein n=1 Tax=Halobacillus litoralis TaxID=45668 RepID=UPI00136AD706|nr:adenylyltransferase/cytidyltransferase family protein [Halobacillus litoralis]
METFYLTYQSADFPVPDPNVMAVGFFDGVHKGHQKVIETAVNEAERTGVSSSVMTFDPHPSVVLGKGRPHVSYITPVQEKERILSGMGVDYLFVVTFDKELAALSPQDFVEHFFVSLRVTHVAAGFDFTFGHKGKGTMKDLPHYAKGRFTQTTVAKVEKDTEKVSSTRIRKLLETGNITAVNHLLGRPFSVEGEVDGPDSSRKIRFFPSDEYLFPPAGVYYSKIFIQGKPLSAAVTISERGSGREHHVCWTAAFLGELPIEPKAAACIQFLSRAEGPDEDGEEDIQRFFGLE